MTTRKNYALVCTDTLPANRPCSFGSISSGAITVCRADIEKLPIEIPNDVAVRMEHVSQLGLKSGYLNLDSGQHVRWAHACGTYTIGSLWLLALYKGERIPARFCSSPYPTLEMTQVLSGYALLLHDYGHLFFSHLLEEALRDINWIPSDHGIASLEYTVLKNRLYEAKGSEVRSQILQSIKKISAAGLYSEPLDLIFSLMQGRSGLSWLQAIVNSPIDADKIDYIRRDQDVLTNSAAHPIRTRLNFGPVEGRLPWFEEFISEQYVNHAGFLCLPGRSALAAGDLWRERLFLHERFYLSPAIRAADRMALELIQQFLIRCVMSEEFGNSLKDPVFLGKFKNDVAGSELLNALGALRSLSETISNGAGSSRQVDVIKVKYEIVTQLLTDLSDPLGKRAERDWECLEFMAVALGRPLLIEPDYSDLLQQSWERLCALKNGAKPLVEFARECIIGNIEFKRDDEEAVREVFRAFQHEHCGDLLVDVSVVPQPLSVPFAPRGRTSDGDSFAGIMVPRGPIERWTSASHDLQPLTPSATKSLERSFGTVLLISPKPLSRSRKLYLLDRALAVAERHSLALEAHIDA